MPKTYLCTTEEVAMDSLRVAQELELPVTGRSQKKMLIGRREWCALPELGVNIVTAKVDTGAYTSSLHAEKIESFEKEGVSWVRFITHDHDGELVHCESPIVQTKKIKSSTGEAMQRFIIKSKIQLAGGFTWDVFFSLADRSVMKCPLLVGRRALSGYFVVDTQESYLFGNPNSLTGKPHHQNK